MDIMEWKKKNSHPAGYAHFDVKLGLNSLWDYITNPDRVSVHSFYPFIHYDQIFYKFSKKNGINEKIRPICYSAHIDRCIYRYYGYLLNLKYNLYVDEHKFSESVVAYRTDLHKSNIHLAKQAFDFIKKFDCNIMVGDFTGFFDNLDHKYLKKNVCKVLGVQTLSKDWYAVYKNITRYSQWELVDILEINKLITERDIEELNAARESALTGKTKRARKLLYRMRRKIGELNKREVALSKEQFKKHKKRCIKRNLPEKSDPNQRPRGIPQGSAISAVLSNVYMIEFDKAIHEYVSKLGGLYLRYSDDFIIIIPHNSNTSSDSLKEYIIDTVDRTEGVELQKDKTHLFSYTGQILSNISQKDHPFKSQIDYLGFVFDGNEVTLRAKTVSKYYYRMYRKLNYIVKCKGISKKGKVISGRELYRIYTQKGRNGEYDESKLPQKIIKRDKNNPYKNGNFLSYVSRADEIFNCRDSERREPITRCTKRHMLKIKRKRESLNS